MSGLKRSRRLAAYLIAISIALIAAVGYRALQVELLSKCDDGAAVCETFADYEKADPFCLTDPSCVSPFYHPYAPGVQRWAGTQWNLAGGQQPPNDSEFFAIPNYLLFLAVAIAAVVCAIRSIQQPTWRHVVITATLVWCGSVVASWWWFVPLGLLDHDESMLSLLEACSTLIVTITTLGLVSGAMARRSGVRTARHEAQ